MGDTGASGVVGFFIIVAIFACTVIGAVLFFLAITRNLGRNSKVISFVAGLLLIPCLLISAPIAYHLLKLAIKGSLAVDYSRPIAFVYLGDDVNSLINNYYVENPLSFTFPNNDEAVFSPDLLTYLSANDLFLKSGFSIQNGLLLSPFGDRVLLAIDKNNDAIIQTTNYVAASPWADKRYSCVIVRHTTQQEAQQSHANWQRQNEA